MSPARTSSRTVGETARSSSEPHSSCTAAAIRRRDLLLLAGHRQPLVERAQHREDARELVDRRAPARLGRVGGHDELHLGLGERVVQLARARPARGQARDRVAQRAAPRRGRLGQLARAQAPDAVVVLGEVHELVPARQHPDEQLELADRRARRRGRRARRPRRRRRRASAGRARRRGDAARARPCPRSRR